MGDLVWPGDPGTVFLRISPVPPVSTDEPHTSRTHSDFAAGAGSFRDAAHKRAGIAAGRERLLAMRAGKFPEMTGAQKIVPLFLRHGGRFFVFAPLGRLPVFIES